MGSIGCFLRLVAMIAGAMFVVSGCDELVIRSGAGAEPVKVALEDLEAGASPASTYVEIGPHLSVFTRCMVSYMDPHTKDGKINADTSVLAVYYPIVSLRSPYAQGKVATLRRYTVLVRDASFEKYGQLPGPNIRSERLRGTVVTSVTRWRKKERTTLRKLYPDVDLDDIMVVESGGLPISLWAGVGRILAGLALFLGGLAASWILSAALYSPASLKDAGDGGSPDSSGG